MAKKMNYDKEEDILFLSRGRKIKSSIDVGDFIIDVDHRGFVSGLEILNASQNLGISPDQLRSLKQTFLRVTYKPNLVFLSLLMKFKDQEKDIRIPLTLNLGHGEIRTENTLFAMA